MTDENITPIRMVYENYAGKVSLRRILPHSMEWGTTQWHPEPQWLMHALDCDKKEFRSFAFRDCRFLPMEAVERDLADRETYSPLVNRLMERDNSRIGKFGPLYHNRDGADALEVIYTLLDRYQKAVEPSEEMIEMAASRMWHAQAKRAGTVSVVKNRTPEAFANEDEQLREKWRDYAKVALSTRL